MNRHLPRIAALIGGLAIAATAAVPVFAATTMPTTVTDTGIARCAVAWVTVRVDRTVTNEQAAGYCEIDRRLDAIAHLRDLVHEAGAVTPAHATALDSILDGSAAGLKALRVTIANDASLPAVTADVRKLFTEYRVYAVVARQVVLVRADDRTDVAADRLTQAAGQLSQAISVAQSHSKDVTAAEGHLSAMTAAISAAQGQVADDAASVLAQTPAGWNAGTAKPVLDAARVSISAAQSDLRTALREARAVMAALR
jgi:hypothetical protein